MSIADHATVQKALDKVQRHGWAIAVHLACLKLVNLVLPFKILRGLHVEKAALAFLSCPGYRPGFVPAAALARFAQHPATELTPDFVTQALQAGDECYAICDGNTLASYGWHSTRPTPVGPPGLLLHFAPGYVYRYKGFTVPRYRGRRLHAVGMTRALRHYLSKDYRGVLCYVESTNLASLKSCRRMGYEVFGSIYLVRILGRYFALSSPGCKRFDFRIERKAQYTAPRAVIGQSASTRPPRTQTYQS